MTRRIITFVFLAASGIERRIASAIARTVTATANETSTPTEYVYPFATVIAVDTLPMSIGTSGSPRKSLTYIFARPNRNMTGDIRRADILTLPVMQNTAR